MNASVYKIISSIGFLMSGIMLVVTVILFFKLNVIKMIGELTGRTAQREIQEISQQTMSYKNGSLKKRRNGSSAYLSRGILQARLMPKKNETKETKMQDEELTTPLYFANEGIGETQPLVESKETNETKVLGNTEKLATWMRVPIKNADIRFEIEKDEVLVHIEDMAETELLIEDNDIY